MKNRLLVAVALSASLASLGAFAADNPNAGYGINGGSGLNNGPAPSNSTTLDGAGVMGGTGKTSFNSMDTGHKGYLTRGDVSADPNISQHFSQCDKNKNGKLSRSEFRACEREYGHK